MQLDDRAQSLHAEINAARSKPLPRRKDIAGGSRIIVMAGEKSCIAQRRFTLASTGKAH